MPASKIVNEQEAIRWIEEGRTYAWMSAEYLRKYNVQTTETMWSNFRRRRGIDRRIARNNDLIPWHVLPKHRWRYPVQMLRAEGRRREGFETRDEDAYRLPLWLDYLAQNDLVVHYDPELEDGFVYIPREDTDDDIIRRPRGSKIRKDAD